MAARDERLVAITPAMREGSGLVNFQREFPERYFDVAIAEQHSVTLAAGMACEGQKPVVAIYSTFLQRAYDQMVHDVALQDLPVVFAVDRAGVVGGDGPTHAGNYDISYARCLPNMVIMTPSNEDEARQMLYTAFTIDGPTMVRYPRGKGPGVPVREEMEAIPLGSAEVVREGKSLAILAFGPMLTPALKAGEALDATVVNMRFVKPLDEKLILELANTHDALVTVDENTIAGGAGSAVNEFLAAENVLIPVLNHGIPDKYIQHGSRDDNLNEAGIDFEGLMAAISLRFPNAAEDQAQRAS